MTMLVPLALLLGCGGVLRQVAPPPPPIAAGAPIVPARARYQYLVGRLALEEGDWEGAERALRTALLHDPRSPWIWLSLADAAAGEGDEGEERRAADSGSRITTIARCGQPLRRRIHPRSAASSATRGPLKQCFLLAADSEPTMVASP